MAGVDKVLTASRVLTHSHSHILFYKVESQRKKGDSGGLGTGEGRRESERDGGDKKDTSREMSRKNGQKTVDLHAMSSMTLIALSLPLFIYNTCTDCVKLYISDQQAKGAWLAPRQFNNTQLPPTSLRYSL